MKQALPMVQMVNLKLNMNQLFHAVDPLKGILFRWYQLAALRR